MTLPSNKPGESFKKFSRGKFLRDSVIAASGIVLLPPMLSGCKKYVFGHGPIKGGIPTGWGGTPTATDVQNAVANLTRMRFWVNEVYNLTLEYDEAAFKLLDSTVQNKNWANFVGNIFIDIGVGIVGAVGVVTGASLAIPAFACLSAFIKDWGIGKETPPDLNGAFAAFQLGHNQMQIELLNKIDHLTTQDGTGVYTNLLAFWQDEIEFQGKSYTLSDLANSHFPDPSDEFDALRDNALVYFRKSLWNLIVIKTCTYWLGVESLTESIDADNTIFDFARDYYKKNPGLYLRGRWDRPTHYTATFFYWYLGLGGNVLPDAAAEVLFMDDTPGHIINPAGLFSRSYFFEQFSTKKNEDFAYYGDEISATDATDFDYANTDFNFTAGLFPSLIEL